MLRSFEFWMLTAMGAIALALSGLNMYLSQANGALQAQANSRAQFIQQSIALEGLYREIVQALADRAVRTRDTQIRDLLAAEGLTVNFDAAPAPAAPETPKP
jgi:hypothetical protein